jgi:hypothetical protein
MIYVTNFWNQKQNIELKLKVSSHYNLVFIARWLLHFLCYFYEVTVQLFLDLHAPGEHDFEECVYTVINRQRGGELHHNEGSRNCVYIAAYGDDTKSEVW